MIVRTLCGSLLWFVPGIGSEDMIIPLLHIRIKIYIKCHSLREFLTHAQLVWIAASFQITGFREKEKLPLGTHPSCTLELEDFYWPIVIRDEFLLIDLNKGIIQLISNSKKITYLHVESSTVVWPPLLYFLSSPSLAVWVWVDQWVSKVNSTWLMQVVPSGNQICN